MKTKFAFLLAASLFDRTKHRTNFVATHSSRTKTASQKWIAKSSMCFLPDTESQKHKVFIF